MSALEEAWNDAVASWVTVDQMLAGMSQLGFPCLWKNTDGRWAARLEFGIPSRPHVESKVVHFADTAVAACRGAILKYFDLPGAE